MRLPARHGHRRYIGVRHVDHLSVRRLTRYPSCALSLRIRSIAASAMTVPGGKMAAAPAARNAAKSCCGMTPPTTTRMSDRSSAASSRFELGHEREMAGGQRRHADDVDVGFDGLARDLCRGLEQRTDVDVEAEIGEGGGDHLLPAIVAVLTDLGDEDARATAVVLGKRSTSPGSHLDVGLGRRPRCDTHRRSYGSSAT